MVAMRSFFLLEPVFSERDRCKRGTVVHAAVPECGIEDMQDPTWFVDIYWEQDYNTHLIKQVAVRKLRPIPRDPGRQSKGESERLAEKAWS